MLGAHHDFSALLVASARALALRSGALLSDRDDQLWRNHSKAVEPTDAHRRGCLRTPTSEAYSDRRTTARQSASARSPFRLSAVGPIPVVGGELCDWHGVDRRGWKQRFSKPWLPTGGLKGVLRPIENTRRCSAGPLNKE